MNASLPFNCANVSCEPATYWVVSPSSGRMSCARIASRPEASTSDSGLTPNVRRSVLRMRWPRLS